MNNNDVFIFVVGVIVGLILAWLYRRRSAKNKNDDNNEEEVKQDFTSNCSTRCVKSSIAWGRIKGECDKYGGKYEKCGDKDIFGNRKGRRCVNYYDPNPWDGTCGAVDDRGLP
jgi:hypothetical protein